MRIPSIAVFTVIAACAGDAPTGPTPAAQAAGAGADAVAAAPAFPDVIALPDGFFPEGIAFGHGTTFYVGSIATGAVFQGDARTGEGSLLVPAEAGRGLAGLEVDAGSGTLFAAGGEDGRIYAFDLQSGATREVYVAADPQSGPTLVNDIATANGALYITDLFRPVLYRLPLGHPPTLPAPDAIETIELTGDAELDPAFSGNGIVATPDGRWLLVVSTFSGMLYRVDPATGHSVTIDLGGASLYSGDGMVLLGRTLYVMQGELDQIAVVALSPDLASGTIERTITSPAFDFPATIAAFGNSLYAVNARFLVEPGPEVEYQVVRVGRVP